MCNKATMDMSDRGTGRIAPLPGARVVTRDGTVAVVMHVLPDGTVMGIGPGDAWPRPVRVVCDAFGGEHDMACGVAS